MEHKILEELLKALEQKFGDMSDDCGAYGDNGAWLSNKAIKDAIEEFDKEYYG